MISQRARAQRRERKLQFRQWFARRLDNQTAEQRGVAMVRYDHRFAAWQSARPTLAQRIREFRDSL